MDMIDFANDIADFNLQLLIEKTRRREDEKTRRREDEKTRRKNKCMNKILNTGEIKCHMCDCIIPSFRVKLIPGATRCFDCQIEYERQHQIQIRSKTRETST
ncbi:TraR/DksA C4-type zinc finger protein [Escherichia coli]|nr:TraR/DksA C4-type zinc finger protein [Escherichia coli]